jgi:hypothetical protein
MKDIINFPLYIGAAVAKTHRAHFKVFLALMRNDGDVLICRGMEPPLVEELCSVNNYNISCIVHLC